MEFELIEDDSGGLTLRRPGGDDVSDVRLHRSFPLSSPGQYVSIRSAEGKELELIEDLAALPSAQRSVVERWLERTTFVPKILRVEELDVRFGHMWWVVQTDRGRVEFRVQEREDVRFLPDGRFRVKDADGNLYELPRLEEMDPETRTAVMPVL